ncbi:uncharacterized protein VP01_6975g1, partial [Puccinia sorghi]
ARLNTTAGQQNPAPAPASNPMVLAKPQPFYGTCGAAAKAFVGQIGLHAITYPPCFPTDASKVAFAVLFMKDYAATYSLMTTTGTLPRLPCRTSARLELCYMQDFNWHTHTVGRANTPLMSLYQHGLKEKIQLAVVMRNLEFDSTQAMNLKAGPTLSLTQCKQWC